MTQPSPKSPERIRWKPVLLVMVVVLLAAEAAAMAIEPVVPPAQGWPTAQIAAKVHQMTDLADSSTGVDVVFLGSSSMDQDLNPLAFNSTGGGFTGYNASFNGASMRSLELWALEVVLPTLDPGVVVLGLTTRELNDGGPRQQQLFDQFAASRGLREFESDGLGHLLSKIESISALLRIRQSLRKPFSIVWRLSGRDLAQVDSLPGPFGQRIPEERDFSYDFSHAWRVEWTAYDMRDFAMGGEEFAALQRLVDALQAQGRTVVLMPLPVSSDYASVQPGGATSLSEFHSLLSSVARSKDVNLLEVADQFESEDFRDPAHLNPVAAEQFSSMLARDLAVFDDRGFEVSADDVP